MGLFSGIVSAATGVVGAVIGGNSANKAAGQASKSEAAQLEFAQQQYDDWKAVYGPVQDNLSSYYSNLSPDYYEALGLEAFELERNNAMEQISTSLAQRGIKDSGIAAEINANADLSAASTRAQIRRQAPVQMATDQQNFLSIGMNASPAPSVSQALNSQAVGARQRSNAASASAGQAWSSATSSLGTLAETGLSHYLGKEK
jgi:uncharacterized sporulation protein YeaH/YhbH (DUF444 family)